jgi:hypothetical protein
MKFTRLPEYANITRFTVIAVAVMLAGCEHNETIPQQQTPQTAVVKSTPVKHAEASKPLDLSLDKIADTFVDTQTDTADAGSSLIMPARKGESRFEFGGNLLTNASVEDYVDSIDGAKINITIKTR